MKSMSPDCRLPTADCRFAELAVTTNFSFLTGASHPEELVACAVALGLAGIGIVDRNTLAGVVRAHVYAREHEIGPEKLRVVTGARLVFSDGTPDILAYPQDRAAYGRLTRLLSIGNLRAEKGDCILTFDDLLDHCEGMQLIVMETCTLTRPPVPHSPSPRPVRGEGRGEGPDECAQEEEPIAAPRVRRFTQEEWQTSRPVAKPLTLALSPRAGRGDRQGNLLDRLLRQAPGRVWLAAAMTYGRGMRRALARRVALARATGAPLIATNDVLMHTPDRRPLADVLTCIREGTTLDAAGRRLAANAERHLKDGEEMARLFREAPGVIEETLRFLDGITFSLDELKYDYPDETREGFTTPQEALEAFTFEGAKRRYPDGVPTQVAQALKDELRLIAELKYAPYFLTVHDIVRFARSQDILCQGRGSAANSSVCFCLGITEVDPARHELLFERFISAERKEPPDIDVDFEHERREEVIQYIYGKYGRHRAGLAASVITYRGRSAIREVGKAFGLTEDTVSALSGTFWGGSSGAIEDQQARRLGLDPGEARLAQAIRLADELNGFPRHLSQHTGGFVVTRSRLDDVVPIMNAAMEDRTTVEWDKDDLDALGLFKIDVLALGMLTCLRKSFEFLDKHYGERLTLATLPAEERAIYAMISRADTIGVFQIESRAQMSMLPRLRPQKFYDLVIEVAIVRPGPIQGDMVHPYLRRRQGLEPVKYESRELEAVLHRTLGVPLFQEQAMKIAIVAAGFTPSEADRLRRAMATFRRVGTIGTFRTKMIEGMAERGYDREFAERCFKQIEGFGEYGFPESHAASFALLVYSSAWIKCRYPDVFAAALLNSQPMGFYAPSQIVRDAREHGVEVREVDINCSDWDCTLEAISAAPTVMAGTSPAMTARALHPRHADMQGDIRTTHAIRLGFRQIVGMREEDMKTLVARRGRGYDSVRDLWLRSGLSPAVLERLAQADAFRSLGLDRRDALWAVRGLNRAGDKDDLPLFAGRAPQECEPDARLPSMPLGEHVVEDYRRLSLSLKAQPVAFVRNRLARKGILRSEELAQRATGERVTVAGLVLVRQRPGTAQGVIFMTIEDETGIANIIVWPKIFERLRTVVIGARFVAVTGKLQNESGVIHVVADHVQDLTPMLSLLSNAGSADISPLAHADEIRRPPTGDQRGKLGSPGSRAARPPSLAIEAPKSVESRRPGEVAPHVKRADIHRVLPKGRNFQ
ncbi:MAG: error-prone DNA polymerase [Methylobacteriaceae bacterium]|nr:error-prone DNA polymerase [Methylobacteriaceae bacterium]